MILSRRSLIATSTFLWRIAAKNRWKLLINVLFWVVLWNYWYNEKWEKFNRNSKEFFQLDHNNVLQERETLSLGSALYLRHNAKLNLYFWYTPRSLGILFWGRLAVKSIQITENSRFGDSCKQHFFGQYPMIFCGNSPQKSARSD